MESTESSKPDGSVEPKDAPPEIRLEDLPDLLQEAAARQGWTELMPVQAKAIPYVRAGRDIMVQSRTGSGKTGAFVLPMLERIDADNPVPQAIVLVPTRELARQVLADAEALARGTGVRTVAVYGGVGYGQQLDALHEGAHLVVGTPGRILDHLMRGTLVLDEIKMLVFDEADRMLSMGFYPDMREIASWLPEKRDSFMFSATYPAAVLSLAKRFLDEPEFMSLSTGHESVAETQHVFYQVPKMEKDRGLIRIIEVENPDSAIIFCNTKATCRYVSIVLKRFGYDAEQLSADLSQSAREKVLSRAYDRTLRFMVATDLAGRGIDISNLSHVVLYDFPEDPESYIHRTGRTGRAGASGEAISLVDVVERLDLKAVARKYTIELEERPLPSDEDLQRVVAERTTALLEQKLRSLDKLVLERMERMVPLAESLGESVDERKLLAMLLDEYYQQSLHAKPDLPPIDTGGGSGGGSHGGGGGGGGGEGGRRRRGGRRSRKD
ncbi:DEAD/DEAH box helicase [bacterium]|nr:DEAD/DEAH box helicase [bacterium]